MGMYTLFSTNIENSYKNLLCSKATVFVIFTTVSTVVFPLIVAYRSRGFWIKQDVFYEQPQIRFQFQYLFIGITNKFEEPIICSTFSEHRELLKSFDKCNSIEVEEIDINEDGINDKLIFRLNLDKNKMELLSFSLILPIDYQLSTVCPLRMQSLITVQKDITYPTELLQLTGDINLLQKSSLNCYLNFQDTSYNYSAITPKTINSYEPFNFFHILEAYSERTISTVIDNIYTFSKPGKSSTFHLELNIRYSENSIRYKPSFFQLLKWAWIQYLPIYMITAWCMKKFQYFVFESNLVTSFKLIPWKKNNFYY